MLHRYANPTHQPDASECVRRFATPEERRFLRRYNLVRVWRMLLFWLLPLFIIGMIAALHGLIFVVLPGSSIHATWPAVVLLTIPLLFLDGVFLQQWGGPLWHAVRMRPFLRVPPDLEVIEFKASLGLQIHRTDHEANLFMAGSTLVDVPQHWEDEVLRRARVTSGLTHFSVARLPGTQGKVIRLPMNRLNLASIKADLLLRDVGDIVVGLDKLAIQDEMQARLPVLRGHPGMVLIALVLGLAAGVLAMLWDQGVTTSMRQQQALAQSASRLESRYLGGDRVDIAALRDRDFDGLAYMPGTQKKVVTGAALERQVVALRQDNVPFLLSQAEWDAIQAVSFIFPRNLPGASPVPTERIQAYRQLLMDRLGADGKAWVRMQVVIQNVPNALVERQLRALSLGNLPDSEFVAALLPMPVVRAGEEGVAYPVGAICKEGEALCRISLRAVVSWDQPAFVSGEEGRVAVVQASEVARFLAVQAELSSIQDEPPRGQMLKGWAIALGVVALLCVLEHWRASRALRRYWGRC